MRNLIAVFVAALSLSAGCAPVMRVYIPEKSPLFRIGPLKGVSAIHSRSILFVNDSPATWQRCLVFEEYHSLDQLFREGGDGLPELQVLPVGYFKVGPRIDRTPAERLVGYFEPRQDYTVLCFLEGVSGAVVDIGIIHLAVPGSAWKYRYRYIGTLGPTEKWVNYLVRLPRHYQHRHAAPVLQIDLNYLVRQLFHQLGTGEIEIEEEETPTDP